MALNSTIYDIVYHTDQSQAYCANMVLSFEFSHGQFAQSGCITDIRRKI